MEISGPWSLVKQLRRVGFLVCVIILSQTEHLWSRFLAGFVAAQIAIIVLPTCVAAIIKDWDIWRHDETRSYLIILTGLNAIFYLCVWVGRPALTITIAILVIVTNYILNSEIEALWAAWLDDTDE
jgi:hypothetical protein